MNLNKYLKMVIQLIFIFFFKGKLLYLIFWKIQIFKILLEKLRFLNSMKKREKFIKKKRNYNNNKKTQFFMGSLNWKMNKYLKNRNNINNFNILSNAIMSA